MRYEINPKTGLPAIVAFRKTCDEQPQLVIFTFCEGFPLLWDDRRQGPLAPTYFMVLGSRVHKFGSREEMWTVAEKVPLMTRSDLLTCLVSGRFS